MLKLPTTAMIINCINQSQSNIANITPRIVSDFDTIIEGIMSF
jgi:hypothetical protein